jgi:hypothetical protein
VEGRLDVWLSTSGAELPLDSRECGTANRSLLWLFLWNRWWADGSPPVMKTGVHGIIFVACEPITFLNGRVANTFLDACLHKDPFFLRLLIQRPAPCLCTRCPLQNAYTEDPLWSVCSPTTQASHPSSAFDNGANCAIHLPEMFTNHLTLILKVRYILYLPSVARTVSTFTISGFTRKMNHVNWRLAVQHAGVQILPQQKPPPVVFGLHSPAKLVQ